MVMQIITLAISLLGISSISGLMWKNLLGKFKDEREQSERENQATKEGVQALLRAQMISEYNKAKDKGYAPIYAKDNFQNMWNNYHKLGVNGVMDGIKDEYLAMPNNPNKKEEDA